MVQGARNKFTLTYAGVSTQFTPKNWEELDVLVSRDRFPVDQQVTAEFELYGDAATMVTTAYGVGANVTLTIDTLGNDWTYGDTWTFVSDLETYKIEGFIVSLGFIENTCRDDIEKNKSTKYDLDIPANLQLLYTGVDREKLNTIQSTLAPGTFYTSLDLLRTNNWIVYGVKTQTEVSDSWIFTDYNGFHARALQNTTASINFHFGTRRFLLSSICDSVKVFLLHIRPPFGVVCEIKGITDATHGEGVNRKMYTISDENDYTILNNGTTWTVNGVTRPPAVGYSSCPILEGDFICLVVNGVIKGSSYVYQYGGVVNPTTFSMFSTNVSDFVSYPVQVVSIEWTIEQLLSKMCAVAPTLTYNLPKYNSPSYGDPPALSLYVPVLTSGAALQHTPTPKMSVSFEDVMKFLRCMYCADYDVLDGEVVIDTVDTFFGTGSAGELTPIGRPKIERDTEHVFNEVVTGWETDDNVENGKFEILCKNTFKINSKVKDKKLDLVSPFKGSPYLIEQYLDEKATQSSKTKEQDNDVFVFCVLPFVSSVTTTLYKYPTGTATTYDTYYNLPMSPMRFILANSKYIGVSLYGMTKELEYVSTDRISDVTTRIQGESAVTENDGALAVLVAGLSTPYFLPERIEFDTHGLMIKADLLANRHKYFTINEKFGSVYNLYINDISLPLTKDKAYTIIGIRR